jgi:hypothetical protein
MKPDQRLFHLAQQELEQLEPNLILKVGDTYTAFGKYQIINNDGTVKVVYQDRDAGIFCNTKHAISYCIADNHNLLNLARRIKELDSRLQTTENGINCRTAVKDRAASTEMRDLASVKLQHRQARQKWIKAELEKCIKSAKYLHLKGFSNETERTGRTASFKTNR